MADTTILHLTPHLGGGVGKALSSLGLRAMASESGMRHVIVCLERPEKTVFLRRILDAGGGVEIAPDAGRLAELVAQADIVHLDWWNHPALFAALCQRPLPPHRLLAWCHVSGLAPPMIPVTLARAAQRMVFTSPCTLGAANLQPVLGEAEGKVSVVSSGCGLEDFPPLPERPEGTLRAGYVGSLNFAKLHPDYVDFLATVDLPGFQVELIGDTLNQAELERRCQALGRPELLTFRGFQADITASLARMDVLVYLLNPEHYGTAENALIEAMAMGVVPIVLDNPAEREIVAHGVTGLVVRTPQELARALAGLAENPVELRALGRRAAETARSRYTSARMEADLARVYRGMLNLPKAQIDYAGLFGAEPADWFLACQGDRGPFRSDGSLDVAAGLAADILHERTKGSVFHFRDRFPGDPRLTSWANSLERVA